ncbi:unnamed protein product [Caretta caretta]
MPEDLSALQKDLSPEKREEDCSKRTRNDHSYQQIVKNLAALQIYQTGDQCKEQIQHLKNKYRKNRDHNFSLGNSLTSCPFYKEFDLVLDNVPSPEPTMVCDDLVRQDDALLAPESSTGTDGSWQQEGQ